MSFDPQASGSEPGPSLRAQSGFNGESPSIRRESARRRDARLEPPPIIAQGERRSTSLERIRPQRVFAPGENRRSRKAPAKAGPRRAVRRMNSTSGAFGRWSACADREGVLCVGGGRRLARSALEGRFQSAQKPSAGGWPARRMNSASRSLRPVVGLRRPGRGFASAEADAWRAAPWKADFNRRKSLRPMVGIRAE